MILGQPVLGKGIWLVALLIGIFWWMKSGRSWDRRRFIDISLAAGLILSPIGWSYDQVMLLFPLLMLLAWVVRGTLPGADSKLILITLILVNLLAYFLRVFTPSDVWFFWIPFVVLALYLFALGRMRNQAVLNNP